MKEQKIQTAFTITKTDKELVQTFADKYEISFSAALRIIIKKGLETIDELEV